jgi:transcriptional accessory protein Tex/SPT6
MNACGICWRNGAHDPQLDRTGQAAARFVDVEKQIAYAASALNGACSILVER